VYRVFPNVEPSQHQQPDASPLPSFQNLWDGSLFSPPPGGGGLLGEPGPWGGRSPMGRPLVAPWGPPLPPPSGRPQGS